MTLRHQRNITITGLLVAVVIVFLVCHSLKLLLNCYEVDLLWFINTVFRKITQKSVFYKCIRNFIFLFFLKVYVQILSPADVAPILDKLKQNATQSFPEYQFSNRYTSPTVSTSTKFNANENTTHNSAANVMVNTIVWEYKVIFDMVWKIIWYSYSSNHWIISKPFRNLIYGLIRTWIVLKTWKKKEKDLLMWKH